MTEDNGSSGFVRLFRSIQDNPIWQNAEYLRIFLYLILNANWKERTTIDGTIVPRGSLITGRAKLATSTFSSEQTIRTCLERLKSTSMITIRTTNTGSLISITNYDTYQSALDGSNQRINQPANQPTTSQQPANNQPTTSGSTTSKRILKELKKEEEECPIPLPALPGRGEPPLTLAQCEQIMTHFGWKASKAPVEEKLDWPAFSSLFDAMTTRMVPQVPGCVLFEVYWRYEAFGEFWSQYWKKAAKKHAFFSYMHKVNSDERAGLLLESMLKQRDKMLKLPDDRRPHAASWINADRFVDEPEESEENPEWDLH